MWLHHGAGRNFGVKACSIFQHALCPLWDAATHADPFCAQGELAEAEARYAAGQRALAEAYDERRVVQAELGACRGDLATVRGTHEP